ncbi:MAG: serine/threonine protein kinase [Armatimonadetes bacterium]|nr:serine/threonine protein kinase [Armatimonadota bacterium]
MSELPHGQVLRSRYKVLSTLGRGSFSSVYLADDAQWKGNLVALKEIRTEGFSHEEYVQLNSHFLQEAAFLMTLKHPGLPRVIEFFAEGSRYYLALEWIAGKTLEEVVLGQDRVEEQEVVGWGLQMCSILAYLHHQKPYPVLLGDLKPSNAVLKYDGTLKLIDFGVARHILPEQRRDFSLVSPGFSPPEQYTQFHVDERGDIYSLGATLYWCLTTAQLERFRFDIPRMRKLRPGASEALENVLSTCLHPDPRLRYSSIIGVARDLQEIRGELERIEADNSPSDILTVLYKQKKRDQGWRQFLS